LAAGIGMLLLVATSVELSGQLPPEIGSRRRASGAAVAPVFEGWEPNADGTVTMYYGYFNRNFEETVDIPVGPNNFFDPAPQDRGQPTHFKLNRQKKSFGVIVPKDTKTLTWTLIRPGQKPERVVGDLTPPYQIEATKAEGNEGPKVNAGPDQTIVLPSQLTLSGTVTDDGLPKGRGGQVGDDGRPLNSGPSTVRVNWRKYRGPGKVVFSNATPPVTGGKATTTASFSQPGVYVLQLIADDGTAGGVLDESGNPGSNLCCSSSDTVTVTVKAAGTP
jgi:hypothetical protein